jgi:hypothetical protein
MRFWRKTAGGISHCAVIRGRLPRKQAKLVRDWAKLRHAELMEYGTMRKRTAVAFGSQASMIDVVSVKPMGGFMLRIGFSDGSVGVHDFSSTTARDGEMVRPLKDPAFFARVFVELGALTWPNGFDVDPIALHDRMSAAGELGREAAE